MSRPVLLVTGGSSGIGAAAARLAARDGYAVALTYKTNPAGAAAVAAAIRAGGGEAEAYPVDVADEGAVAGLFEAVDARFGRLDALVSNAGAIGWEGRVDECDGARLAALWAVNLTSCFLCAGQAIRRMSTRHGGRGGAIVNVSSLSGRTGGRDGRVHYAASKGAVDTFTRGLAKEVAAEGVRVNAVAPAYTATPIHDAYGGAERAASMAATIPMGRVGEADETAEAILWLLSGRASFVTGIVLDVAGGA